MNKPITTLCSILFLLQLIVLRSPLIFPHGPAGMARHLYNLLYTNPLAIFCQINMTVASSLILSPYHTTAIPPTLQHSVGMPPYIVCHMHGYCMHNITVDSGYCHMILPWVLPLLHNCMLLMHCRYCQMRGYCCHFIL